MRTQAIENLLKLLIKADERGDYVSFNNYVTKARIILNRNTNEDASVIRDLANQKVEFE